MDVRPVLVAVVVLAAAACGGSNEDGAAPSSPSPSAAPELQNRIDQARELVAAEAGVDADEVELVEASEVTWSDGALGCPEPDQVYTQALVEGYQVVLEAGGETFHVHGGQQGDPFICADPQPPAGNATS